MKRAHGKLLNVIIETPAGSQHKYAFDEKTGLFRLKKTLPMGSVFPFDFGFIPGTKGEDGDPLDILVIMERPVFPGCLLECRVLGIMTATQQHKHEDPVRNDRLVGVSATSPLYHNLEKIRDLNKELRKEIEHFFENYNREEGKVFKVKDWLDEDEAWKMIHKSLEQ
jgi:inorganic pyrophosphatase